MAQTIEPCTSEQEVIDAKALIAPVQLQSLLPEAYKWAFIKVNGMTTGVLMWRETESMPTEIELAITLIDQDYPNENLYVGVV